MYNTKMQLKNNYIFVFIIFIKTQNEKTSVSKKKYIIKKFLKFNYS